MAKMSCTYIHLKNKYLDRFQFQPISNFQILFSIPPNKVIIKFCLTDRYLYCCPFSNITWFKHLPMAECVKTSKISTSFNSDHIVYALSQWETTLYYNVSLIGWAHTQMILFYQSYLNATEIICETILFLSIKLFSYHISANSGLDFLLSE